MKGSKQTKGRKCKIDEYDLPLVVRSNWSTSLLSDPESEVSAVCSRAFLLNQICSVLHFSFWCGRIFV